MTLTPSRYLQRVRALRWTYIFLAIAATTVALCAVGERLATNFYGLGLTIANTLFLFIMFVLLWLAIVLVLHLRRIHTDCKDGPQRCN